MLTDLDATADDHPTAEAGDSELDPALLVDAAGLLAALARDPDDPDEARRSLARLQARHADCRLHLIPDEEAHDGSLHHALLARRRDGLALSMSVSAGRGLPWPLRGVVR